MISVVLLEVTFFILGSCGSESSSGFLIALSGKEVGGVCVGGVWVGGVWVHKEILAVCRFFPCVY